MKKPEIHTTVLRLDDTVHQEIRKRALDRNISMNLWIVRAIIEALKKEDAYK